MQRDFILFYSDIDAKKIMKYEIIGETTNGIFKTFLPEFLFPFNFWHLS